MTPIVITSWNSHLVNDIESCWMSRSLPVDYQHSWMSLVGCRHHSRWTINIESIVFGSVTVWYQDVPPLVSLFTGSRERRVETSGRSRRVPGWVTFRSSVPRVTSVGISSRRNRVSSHSSHLSPRPPRLLLVNHIK